MDKILHVKFCGKTMSYHQCQSYQVPVIRHKSFSGSLTLMQEVKEKEKSQKNTHELNLKLWYKWKCKFILHTIYIYKKNNNNNNNKAAEYCNLRVVHKLLQIGKSLGMRASVF